jgi:hypothetical protein
MRRVVLLVVAGCSFAPPHDTPPEAAVADGAPDATSSAGCIIGSDLGVKLCPVGSAGSALDITATTAISTDTGDTTPADSRIACAAMTAGSTPEVCAIFATTIAIEAGVALSASGGKPLVLIATGSAEIDGKVDVASHDGSATGPDQGGDWCVSGLPPTGAGGGQGGSYGTAGGEGGSAALGSGSGGDAAIALAIAGLVGGCPGASGGNAGGSGGAGGGVVLIATPVLAMGSAGQIDASGAGGKGASAAARSGGGGGGAGGLVALLVGELQLGSGAQIYANGGAGGGASSSIAATDGTDPSGASSGGTGGTPGGNGGAGGTGATRGSAAAAGGNGSSTSNPDGGGGGGGGAGAIVIRPPSSAAGSNANVSPEPR